jgi:hypothetical protein
LATVRARSRQHFSCQVLNDPRNLMGSVACSAALLHVQRLWSGDMPLTLHRRVSTAMASVMHAPLQFAESVRKSPGRTTQSPRSPGRNTENCFIWAFSAHHRWIRGVSIKATGRVPIRQGLRPITASRALIGCIVRCDYRAFPRFRSRARVAVNPPPPPPDLVVDSPMAAEVDQKGSCDFPFALCVPISFLSPPPLPPS